MEENNQDTEEYLAIGFGIEQPSMGEVFEERTTNFFEAALPNPDRFSEDLAQALGTIPSLE